jgi:hypothetical protein
MLFDARLALRFSLSVRADLPCEPSHSGVSMLTSFQSGLPLLFTSEQPNRSGNEMVAVSRQTSALFYRDLHRRPRGLNTKRLLDSNKNGQNEQESSQSARGRVDARFRAVARTSFDAVRRKLNAQ